MNKPIAYCPKSWEHWGFITGAHVAQDWNVDREGNFLSQADDGGGEVTHGPDPQNTWICATCGAEALFATQFKIVNISIDQPMAVTMQYDLPMNVEDPMLIDKIHRTLATIGGRRKMLYTDTDTQKG